MSRTLQRNFVYLIGALGIVGVLFNLVQVIIIINGGYNRNPNIESPLLQTLDSVALTGLWLLVSLVMLLGAIGWLRQKD